MSEKKWYRVIDPMCPLFGCDVTGEPDVDGAGVRSLLIMSMRRVDVFVGDRPFQLVGAPGESLGILVYMDRLDDSPIQEDVIELATDRPYGITLDESEMTRKDGLTLRMVRYETATQLALDDSSGVKIGGETIRGFRGYGTGLDAAERKIIDMFEQGYEDDELLWQMGVNATGGAWE